MRIKSDSIYKRPLKIVHKWVLQIIMRLAGSCGLESQYPLRLGSAFNTYHITWNVVAVGPLRASYFFSCLCTAYLDALAKERENNKL